MPRPPPLSTVHVLTVQLYRHPVSVRPSGLSLGCPRWLAEASPVRLSIVSLDTHTLWHARPATIPYRPGPGPPFRSSCGLTRHDTCVPHLILKGGWAGSHTSAPARRTLEHARRSQRPPFACLSRLCVLLHKSWRAARWHEALERPTARTPPRAFRSPCCYA